MFNSILFKQPADSERLFHLVPDTESSSAHVSELRFGIDFS